MTAMRRWPYASAMIAAIPMQRSPGLGTMAVTKNWVLLYDSQFVDRWSVDELASVVQHEALHLLLDHHTRGQALKDDKQQWQYWNMACDFAVNSVLQQEDAPLPDGGLFPSQYGFPPSLSADEYYRLLMQAKPDPQQTGQEKIDNKDSDASGPPRETQDAVRKETEAKAQSSDSVAARAITVHSSGGRHNVVNMLRRYMNRATRSASAGIKRRTYATPSRRRESRDVIIPGNRVVGIDCCIGVDTSGSMAKYLPLAFGVIDEAMRGVMLNNGLRVVSGDDELRTDQRVKRMSDVQLGGGGWTDMSTVVGAVGAKSKPDVMLLVTDGETPWPDRVQFPLVVLLTPGGSEPPDHIPFVRLNG